MPAKHLNAKQTLFVEHYLKHGNAGQAAKAAGYAATSGSQLLRGQLISRHIAERQKVLRRDTGYGVAQAMAEAQDAMDDARKWRNANALVKAVELRSKLMGLLVDRLDVRSQVNFRINIVGISPSSSAAALPPSSSSAAVEDPFKVVDGVAHLPMRLNPEREIDTVDEEEDIFGL